MRAESTWAQVVQRNLEPSPPSAAEQPEPVQPAQFDSLPPELLACILCHISSARDLDRCSCVCSALRAAHVELFGGPLGPRRPTIVCGFRHTLFLDAGSLLSFGSGHDDAAIPRDEDGDGESWSTVRPKRAFMAHHGLGKLEGTDDLQWVDMDRCQQMAGQVVPYLRSGSPLLRRTRLPPTVVAPLLRTYVVRRADTNVDASSPARASVSPFALPDGLAAPSPEPGAEPVGPNQRVPWSPRSVAAAHAASFALDAARRLWSWGDGEGGVLGHGSIEKRVAAARGARRRVRGAVVPPHLARSAQRSYTDGDHLSEALDELCTLDAEGEGAPHQDDHVLSPHLVGALARTSIVQVSSKNAHCLAVSATGLLYSWGHATCGCLGHGDNEAVSEPRLVRAFMEMGGRGHVRVIEASAGFNTSLAVSDDGRLFGWGEGESLTSPNLT